MFLRRRINRQTKLIPGPNTSFRKLGFRKVLICSLKETLTLRNNLNSEIAYIKHIRIHDQIQFRKSWADYEILFRQFLSNYIRSRWVRQKAGYLDERGKTRDRGRFVEAEVGRLY